MKKQKKRWIISIIVIIVIIFGFTMLSNGEDSSGQYDSFAQCLTEKGATFYGSYQCSHCKDQKEEFGNSIQYINYVECGPLAGPIANVCKEAGIEVYPTWIIDGVKYRGKQSFSKLSELTSCSFS